MVEKHTFGAWALALSSAFGGLSVGSETVIEISSNTFAATGAVVEINFPKSLRVNANEALYLVEDGTGVRLPLQQHITSSTRFLTQIRTDFPANKSKTYRVISEEARDRESAFGLSDDGEGVTFKHSDDSILRYNYQPYSNVELKDPSIRPVALKRSGNIHPIWSPSGSVLTEAYPKSHFHHIGVWGAWVRTQYEGESYDFWNLKSPDDNELVAFTAWQEKPHAGPIYAGFTGKHQYTLDLSDGIRTLMDESLDVQIYKFDAGFSFDYTLTQKWLDDSPLELAEYRYGGTFAWRYPSAWDATAGLAVSSEGDTQILSEKTGIDAKSARWLKVEAFDGEKPVGFLIMSHPNNFRHPELTRLLHDGAGKGGYVHFTPVRSGAWQLNNTFEHISKYRVVTFDGKLSSGAAELLWQQYAKPPVVTVK